MPRIQSYILLKTPLILSIRFQRYTDLCIQNDITILVMLKTIKYNENVKLLLLFKASIDMFA